MSSISRLVIILLTLVIVTTEVHAQLTYATPGIEAVDSNSHKLRRLVTCVTTETALRNAVKAAPNGKNTTITLCTATISLSSTVDPVSKLTGIVLTDKVINLQCSLPSNSRCNLDGAHRSRIFYGSNAKLSATKVSFVNGSTKNDCSTCNKDGGAILLKGNSNLRLDRTSFTSNNAVDGGAIYLEDSTLALVGGSTRADGTIFSKNSVTGYAGAVFAKRSRINTEKGYIIFRNNTGSISYGAMGVEDCPSVTLKTVNFYQNVASSYSAIGCLRSTLTMENVVIADNTQDSFGALYLSGSKANLKSVSLVNNKSRRRSPAGMLVVDSMVNLTSSLFDRNVVPNGEIGANIDVYLKRQKSSYVFCLSNHNVFCMGLSSNSIDGTDFTNCETLGIAGTPRVAPCT